MTERKKKQQLSDKRCRRGNGVSKCSWCCHANESGASAMLTNSNSHCWTHHLLMLHAPPIPPIVFSFTRSPSPVLSPGSLLFFCSLSRSLLLGPGHLRDNSWVGGAAVAHTGKSVRFVCFARMCATVYPLFEVKKKEKERKGKKGWGIDHLNDGDADQRKGSAEWICNWFTGPSCRP